MRLRILSAGDVRRALPMAAAIEGMKQAYAQLSQGQANMPLRGRVHTDESSVVLVMPAYLPQNAALGVKVVSVFPKNSRHNLPIIHALVMLLDAQSGQPLALMEGSTLTALRTGAGSGAATDILAPQNAKTVAIIGSGVQARTQLEAVCTVRAIEQVYVYSRTQENAEKFADEMAGRDPIPLHITAVDSPQEAVQAADIICAATTSDKPVFDGADLRAGTHINGVGSYLPTMQEVDVTTLQRALVTVDSRGAALEEAGDLIVPLQQGNIDEQHIHAEIGEIIAELKTGRTSAQQITYFKSVGVAVQDAAAARIVLGNAIKHNLGTLVEL